MQEQQQKPFDMAQAVSEMNEAFGNPKGNPHCVDWQRIEKQAKCILGEFNELMAAIDVRDLNDVRDALCDINVFSMGVHHLLGIDVNVDMKAVLDGVMTRFCKNEADLVATMDKYDNLGVVYYVQGEYPRRFLKSAYDQDGFNGEFYPQGKFLKSSSFSEPVFAKIETIAPIEETLG